MTSGITRFDLTFEDSTVAARWGSALFGPETAPGVSARAYERVRKLAAITGTGSFVQITLLNGKQWVFSRLTSGPATAHVEEVDPYEDLKTRPAADAVDAAQEDVVRKFDATGAALDLRRRWLFLSSSLAIYADALFHCDANSHVTERIIDRARSLADRVGTGDVSIDRARTTLESYVNVVFDRNQEAG